MKKRLNKIKTSIQLIKEKRAPFERKLTQLKQIFALVKTKLMPIHNFFYKLYNSPIVCCVVIALTLNLVVEILSRRSFLEGLIYLLDRPFIFLVNAMIIFLTLSLSFLFKRRLVVLTLVSSLWLGLAIANFTILAHRNTPLGALDFKVLKSVLSIVNVYLSTGQMLMIGIALLGVLFFLILSWGKIPAQKNHRVRSVSTFMVSALIIACIMGFSIKNEALATNFGNVVDAYNQYGFAYCFSCSVVASGISKPSNYSSAKMHEIIDPLNPSETATPERTPNIILLQLESFFDPNYLQDLTFSENPVPYFSYLKENYSSGFLTVPGVGAGTANTEFEVITGMNLSFFGPGEFPYMTFLKSTTCETIGYNLKELGYNTHALHNHTGTFYTRHEVYPQLGFDEFTPIECMSDIVRNPLDWAKDIMLVKEIKTALKATEEQDFIFAVSVQGHGKYPDEIIDETQTITIAGIEIQEKINAYEYYVNQLREMDEFVQELTTVLDNYDEDVVLVLYGDHLPGFEIEYADLSNGNIYQSEYVIWSNFPLEKEDKDLYTYQLSANVLGRLGINNGIFTKYHQTLSSDIDYQQNLKLLQYDMIYADQVAYGGYNPYQATKMRFGVTTPIISKISRSEDVLHISGGKFNKWSKVYINGTKVSAKLLDQDTLLVTDVTSKTGDIITIRQVGKNNTIYNESPGYMLQ